MLLCLLVLTDISAGEASFYVVISGGCLFEQSCLTGATCGKYDDEPHGHYTTEYANKFLARLKEALDPTNVKTGDHLLWLLKQNNWWFYDKVGTS